MSLDLTPEQRTTIKRFRDDGLLWLSNAAIFHPRGYALTVHLDENGEPIGLSVQGDGTELWCFGPDYSEVQDSIAAFMAAEIRREEIIAIALGRRSA